MVATACQKHLYDLPCIEGWFDTRPITDRKCLICLDDAFPITIVRKPEISSPLEQLQMACRTNDAEALRQGLENRPELISEPCYNLQSGESTSLLSIALHRNNTEAALVLIAANADIVTPLENGLNPLHQAAANGDYRVVSALLQRGELDPDITPRFSPFSIPDVRRKFDITGIYTKDTPIGYAAARGHLPVIKHLIEAGSKAELIRHNRHNAALLEIAVDKGHGDIVEFLISDEIKKRQGVSQIELEDSCLIAMITPCVEGRTAMIKSLLNVCNTERVRSEKFLYPLWFAVKHNHTEIVETMLKAGFKNQRSHYGTTLRQYAQKHNLTEITALIDQYGVDDSPSSFLHKATLTVHYYMSDWSRDLFD